MPLFRLPRSRPVLAALGLITASTAPPACRGATVTTTTAAGPSGSAVPLAPTGRADAQPRGGSASNAGAPSSAPAPLAVPPLLTCAVTTRGTPLRLTLDAQGATLRAVDPARAIACRAQIRRVRDCRGCARNFAVIEFAPFACTGEALVADRSSLQLEPYPRIDRATLMGLGSGGMEACEIEQIDPAGLDPLPGQRPNSDASPASGS